jgi:hypothetical protein
VREIPQWVIITAGAVAVVALVYGRQLGMDLSPTTLATIGAVVGAVVNFLGRNDHKSDRKRDEEDVDDR